MMSIKDDRYDYDVYIYRITAMIMMKIYSVTTIIMMNIQDDRYDNDEYIGLPL